MSVTVPVFSQKHNREIKKFGLVMALDKMAGDQKGFVFHPEGICLTKFSGNLSKY